MKLLLATLAFFLLLLGAFLLIPEQYRIPPIRQQQIFLEVVLDSEHPGQLLCNKPSGKLAPCTVEVGGDGWVVKWKEKP